MTPEEWRDILFRQHIKRLTEILEAEETSEESSDNVVVRPTRPVFTIITDGDEDAVGGSSPDVSNENIVGEMIKRLPISLEEALEDINERRLLYLTFRNIFMSSLDTLEALAYGTRELIPAGARWFMDAWVKYPLLDQRDFCYRVIIFGCFKRLFSILTSMHPPPANRDVVKKHLKSALSLESAMDLTATLLVDVEAFTDEGLVELAWKTRCLDLVPNVEEDAKEDVDKALEKMGTDLRNLPFHPPRPVDEERLTQYLSDLRSRSDGYCLLLSLMESLATRMAVSRRKGRRKSTHVNGGRGMTMDVETGVAFTKLEWVATFIAQQTHSSLPTPALCLSSLKILHRISKLVDPENINMSWKENAGELESRLDYSYNRQQTAVKSGGSPAYAGTQKRGMPFFIKLLHQKRKKEVLKTGIGSSEFPSEDSLVKELSSVKNELEDVIASIEDMWFQVDAINDRIVVKPSSNGNEKYSDETLISIQSGTLVLTRKELIWSSSRSFNGVGTGVELEAGIRLPYSSITRFTYGRLDHTSIPTLPPYTPNDAPVPDVVDPPKPRKRSALTMDGLPTIEDKDDEEVKGNVRKMSLKFKNVAVKKKSYHLDIHTKDEVFKFFPFHGDEIHQMVKALGSVSGLVPFREEEFVQNVLCKKLETTRRQALKYLLEEENPWIEHSADLTAVIEALTSDNQPQRIVDMERLFHSCRIEIEVTKEAIFLLRKTWHTTQSESVKLKVLSVVDRLLDRVVMRQGDGNFGVTFKWLKHLEETVSPYKSAESLKLIIHLVRRAKMIQIEPLSPIVRNQCNALFDSFNEHIFLQTFFDDTEEHGIPF